MNTPPKSASCAWAPQSPRVTPGALQSFHLESMGSPGGPAGHLLGVHGSPWGPAVSVGLPGGPAARPVRVYRSPWTRALQGIHWESMGHPLGPAESAGHPRPGPCSVCGSPLGPCRASTESPRVTPDLHSLLSARLTPAFPPSYK